MRILGIDWGKTRLGLALSDLTGLVANPISPINRKGDKADIGRILELVEEHEVERIVVGIPLDINGKQGESALAAAKFAAMLEEAAKVPVDTIDERYSTHAAERSLMEADLSRSKRKKLRDGVAAAWFLQNYLDSMERENKTE